MKNSSKFFSNVDCEYFPCHNGVNKEEFNCLFCYCPLNQFPDCPGNPRFIEISNLSNNKVIKNCSHCDFPHKADNYNKILDFIKNKMRSE